MRTLSRHNVPLHALTTSQCTCGDRKKKTHTNWAPQTDRGFTRPPHLGHSFPAYRQALWEATVCFQKTAVSGPEGLKTPHCAVLWQCVILNNHLIIAMSVTCRSLTLPPEQNRSVDSESGRKGEVLWHSRWFHFALGGPSSNLTVYGLVISNVPNT